jgi:hypothetical protein
MCIRDRRRTFRPPIAKSEELDLLEVDLFDLAENFFLIMKRKERENFRVIKGKDVSAEEKIKEIIDYLEKTDRWTFWNIFPARKLWKNLWFLFSAFWNW